MSDDQTYTVPAAVLDAEGASNFTPTSYDIAAEDSPIADRILSMDPLNIDGSGRMYGALHIPDDIPVTALSPEMRAEVQASLRDVPEARRAEAEACAVKELLTKRAMSARIKTGLDADAPRYWHEMVDIAREVQSLSEEFNRITARMTVVDHYEHEIGADGKSQPKAVYVMGAAEQRASATRLAEIDYQIKLLVNDEGGHGLEAQGRLAKALHDSVAEEKAMSARLDEHREAHALADQILREERVKEQAELLAKHKRHTL